jgi:hypothetical protein
MAAELMDHRGVSQSRNIGLFGYKIGTVAFLVGIGFQFCTRTLVNRPNLVECDRRLGFSNHIFMMMMIHYHLHPKGKGTCTVG